MIFMEQAAAFLLRVLVLVFQGWVGAMIWSWHVVPIGMPEISASTVIGIMALMMIVTPIIIPKGELIICQGADKSIDRIYRWTMPLFHFLMTNVAWGVAWLAHMVAS